MKVFRRLLVAAVAAALALGALVAVAFNPGVQTWALRRALAERPGIRATVNSLSAGLRSVEVRDAEYRIGAAVLTIPHAVAAVPLWSAGVRRQVLVSKVEAKGWTLDLSRVAPPAAPAELGAAGSPLRPGSGSMSSATAAVTSFAGVFAHLGLPFDLSLDGVTLEGEVLLPEGRGRVDVRIGGGGLGAGRTGNFTIHATAALNAAEVSRVDLAATLGGSMDSPRSFTRLGLALAADAMGSQFPAGAKLAIDVTATRTAGGETYSAAVVSGLRELMKIDAAFPPGGNRLEGTWRLDVREADVLPFALGQPLPSFTVLGEGRLGADAAFAATRIVGRLEATAGKLQVIAPALAGWGDVALSGHFDVIRRAESVAVERLEATLRGMQPIAMLRGLQPFEFRPGPREFRASRDDRALLGVTLQALPLEWVRPWLEPLEVAGGAVRGEVHLWARPGGGLGVRTEAPLAARGVAVGSEGKRWLQDVGLTVAGSADFSDSGWQVDLMRGEVRHGDADVAALVGKFGRLAGTEQAVKSTGSLRLNLAEVLRQPLAGPGWRLAGGEATVDYAVSLGRTRQVVAKVELSAQSVDPDGTAMPLPRVNGDLRMDVGPGGRTEFRLPLAFRFADRLSDALVAGTVEFPKQGGTLVDASIASDRVVIDDLRRFAGLAAATSAGAADNETRAPWSGLSGRLALALKEVVWNDTLTIRGFTGRVEMDAGKVKLDEWQAGVGEKGRANLKGALSFEAGAERPYDLAAELTLRDIESGLLFGPGVNGRPATLEGRFDLTGNLAGRTRRFRELATTAGGDLTVTSRGGVFRGLPVAYAQTADTTGRLAGFVATAGSVLSGITGRREPPEIGSRAEAVTEFARALNPIHFDQLSLVIIRDAAQNTTFRSFVLIAPELRLTGGGTALRRPGGSLFDDALAMEFKLLARGRQGEVLKFLGVLDTQPDELGYLPCSLPLRVTGSLAKPDASEVNVKLAALALEKAGVSERASELFNRVFGVGK